MLLTSGQELIAKLLMLLNAAQARALWYNMREEPVVYINGRPFRAAGGGEALQEHAGVHRH